MSALSQALISDLPDDVLLIIIGFVSDGNFDVCRPGSRYTMMAVCQSWRQLIMSSPILWKNLTVVLDVPMPPHTHPILSQALRLSVEAPLTILLRIGRIRRADRDPTIPELEQTVLATLDTLYSSASRWAYLELRINNQLLFSILPALDRDMSSLESVLVHNMCLDARITDATPLLAFTSAPRLGTVKYIGHAAIFSNLGFPWAGVRSLSIPCAQSSENMMERTSKLLDIVGAAVDLQELKLLLFDKNAGEITMSLPCVINASIQKLGVHSYHFKALSFLRMPALRELHVHFQAKPGDQDAALDRLNAFVASSPRVSLLSCSSFVFSPSMKTLLNGMPSVMSVSWTFHHVDVVVGFLTFLSTSTCLPLLGAVTIEFSRGEYFLVAEQSQFDEKFVDAVLHLTRAPHWMGVLTRLKISIYTFDSGSAAYGSWKPCLNNGIELNEAVLDRHTRSTLN